MAARKYVPQVYEDVVTLCWASSDLRGADDFVGGWRELAVGGLEVHEIPGSHLNIIEEPHVAVLAAQFDHALLTAQRSVVENRTSRPASPDQQKDSGPESFRKAS